MAGLRVRHKIQNDDTVPTTSYYSLIVGPQLITAGVGMPRARPEEGFGIILKYSGVTFEWEAEENQ